MTVEERVQELFDNEELLDSVFKAETPEALIQLFAENGVVFEDVTKEEVFDAFQRARTDELSEDDLENVSGGVYLAIKAGAIYFAVSGSVGAALCVAGGVAVIGLAAYAGYRLIKKYTK